MFARERHFSKKAESEQQIKQKLRIFSELSKYTRLVLYDADQRFHSKKTKIMSNKTLAASSQLISVITKQYVRSIIRLHT